MNTIHEIQSAIGTLPHNEYLRLLSWIHERDFKEWDNQLESDVASGKLDFLAQEAMEEKKNRQLKRL